jgi:uncharacterized protein
MKASRYNIASDDPLTGDLLLFNAMYGSMATISARSRTDALVALCEPDRPNRFQERFVNLKFIVSNDVDEFGLLQQRKAAGVRDKNRLDVIVMPNLDCNFACTYCYEKKDRASHMSGEVQERVQAWLLNEIPRHKVLLLGWFGGEPLLDPDIVVSLTAAARDHCAQSGVHLLSHITTNGYALNDNVIARLFAVGLRNFQITVDGPARTHDRLRTLRNGRGTFERIRRNIIALTKVDRSVSVSIRVNYNHQNIDVIPELLGAFPQDLRQQLRIVFEPIFGARELSATENIAGDEISAKITSYYSKAAEMGYDIRLGRLDVGRLVYCYAERENQFIIDFKGDVFKCSVGTFKPEERIASIDLDGRLIEDSGRLAHWLGMEAFAEHCESCTFLPLCMGGCRKSRREHGTTGSYCSLVPTNTSHTLKSIAFGSFKKLLVAEAAKSHNCARSNGSCGYG